jgi:hypothetical protein
MRVGINRLQIVFSVSIQLNRNSADFSRVDRSTILDCTAPQSEHYVFGSNSIALRTPDYFPDSGPAFVTSFKRVPFAPIDMPAGARWRITHPDLGSYWRYRDASMQFFADLSSDWPQDDLHATYILPKAPQDEPGAVAALVLDRDKTRLRGSQSRNSIRKDQPVWDGDLMLMVNRAGRAMLIELSTAQIRVPDVAERYHYTEVDTNPEICRREAFSFDNGYCKVFLTELSYRYWIMKRIGELDFSCAR